MRLLFPKGTLAALMVAGFVSGLAASARAQEVYTLQPGYKAGDAATYRTVVNIEAEGTAPGSQIAIVTKEQIKSVNDDGTITVTTTFATVEANINGTKATPPVAGQSFTTILDRSGRMVKQEGIGAGLVAGLEQLIEVSRMSVTPDAPLKVGQDWKYDLSIGADKKQKVAGTLTILGIEKKGAELPSDMLKVRNVADLAGFGPNHNQNVHLELIQYLDLATSRPQRTDGTIAFARESGGAKLQIRRVRIADVSAETPAGTANGKN